MENKIVWNFELVRDLCGGMYKHLSYGTGKANRMLWRIFVFPQALDIATRYYIPVDGPEETASDAKKHLADIIINDLRNDKSIRSYITEGSYTEERLNRIIAKIHNILYANSLITFVADGILNSKKYQAFRESMNNENPEQARNLLRWMSRHTDVDEMDVIKYVQDTSWKEFLPTMSGED